MGDKTKGLYDKFRVSRVDGSDAPGGKHHGCRYYVLDIDHDRFAIAAINAYARACKPHYPFLADDLESLVGIEDDPRDRRIAELEVENERLRAALLIAEHGLTTSHGLMAYDDGTVIAAKQHFRLDNTEELDAIRAALVHGGSRC